MPTDYKRTVLLGDADPERSAILIDILENNFRTKVVRVEEYRQVNDKVLEALRAGANWRLVLMAADLPQSVADRNPVVPRDFYNIGLSHTFIGCVHTSGEPLDSKTVGSYVPSFRVPSPEIEPEERRAFVIEKLADARIAGLKPRRKSNVKPEEDPILSEQINGLGVGGDAKSALNILAYLIGDFQSRDEPVTISKLIQGASGSKVFRFRPEPDDSEDGERVLKIVHYSHEWKLTEEVKRHLLVQKRFGEYKLHVPKIVSFETGDGPEHITRYENWRAIAYDFLGPANFAEGQNRFGKFMDLETALAATADELRKKTADTRFQDYFATDAACPDGRARFLELLLNWLSDKWYSSQSVRKEQVLWDYSNGPDDKFDQFPPYRIPGRSKRYILNFLDSRAAKMGSRLLDGWEESLETVREFVVGEPDDLGKQYTLAAPYSLILAPAHGDLNSNNIFVWLDEAEHPFLIDFPLYQESGHAMQDFARLEVEVKFTLMDRQADSDAKALPAFDFTHTQVPLWQKLEQHLLSETWEETLSFPSRAFVDNVKLAYDLVRLIRAKAQVVQSQHQTASPVPFWREYRPALLYHTMRAIGYDSLSPFKRFLAVYSAANLLAQSRLP